MIYVGLLVFSFLLEFLQTYFMQWTGQKVMFDLRRQIFRHLQRLHVAFFDKNPVGRLVTRVTTDVDALNEMFTSGVVSIFEDLFVLFGILGVMLCMNWKLALITFAVLPFIVYSTKIFRDRVRDSYRRIRVAIARINSYLQEHISGMVVLQLFNRERKAYNRFSEINRNHMDAYKDAIMAYSVYYPVVEILSAIAIASVIWFGGGDVMRNVRANSVAVQFNWKTLVAFRLVPTVASLGVLVAFIQYALRFFRPIMDFSEKYNILQSAMAASERIFKLLDTPVQVVSPAVTTRPAGPGRIEFDHVWFAYHDTAEGDQASRATGFFVTSLHHRARRNRGHRRPHWRRQDHAHLTTATLLRCSERRGSNRRSRHQRHGSCRVAQPFRRGSARSIPVQRDDRREYQTRDAAHSG